MRMKRLILYTALVLGGCQSTVTEPEQTTVLAGDYQLLSDCFYRKVATAPGFKKVDDPSTRTNIIEGRSNGGPSDKIAFTATGDGITKVRAQLATPGGSEAWAGYLSALKECENP